MSLSTKIGVAHTHNANRKRKVKVSEKESARFAIRRAFLPLFVRCRGVARHPPNVQIECQTTARAPIFRTARGGTANKKANLAARLFFDRKMWILIGRDRHQNGSVKLVEHPLELLTESPAAHATAPEIDLRDL